MAEDDAKYKEEFNKKYLPHFTQYFSQSKMEKKITSYKNFLEEMKKVETTSTESAYKHVMTKKVLLTSKNAKTLCRSGIQFKHFRNVILKMFNVDYSKEDYENKIKDVFKGRSFEDMEDIYPTFTAKKTLEESLPFNYLNEKGINALKEVVWLLNGVISKIEYSPTLLSVASLLLIFLTKEETYEVLRNIIESDQNVEELKKLRWHFRYTMIENIKMNLSIKTCILDITKEKDNTSNHLKLIESMGLPTFELIKDMTESFFMDYVNFLGITKFLSFFLLEGVKGIYRLVYALISLCSLTKEAHIYEVKERVSNPNKKLTTLNNIITFDTKVEKINKEEIYRLFKEKSNNIEKWFNLMEVATSWKLTHSNNNYLYQYIPASIRESLPQLKNLIYIPAFVPESRIIKRKEIPKLWELIPSYVIKFCNGILLFDKEKNPECDIKNIYNAGEKLDEKSKIMFIIQTTNDEVFGGIMEQNIRLKEDVKYLVPSVAYLFSVRPELKIYEPNNKQIDEIACFEPGAIRFGYGREGPAITINYDLKEGSTERNTVFGKNICLLKDYSDQGNFTIKGLEIYLMQ